MMRTETSLFTLQERHHLVHVYVVSHGNVDRAHAWACRWWA